MSRGAPRREPAASPPRTASPLGRELARLRQRKGVSQLRLATAAQTSPRHVSFIETGRSRPGRPMVLRLAEALELSLRERNALLAAAGFAPLYPERPLDDAQLAPLRRVVSQLLEKQEPYPALVYDRALRVLAQNRAAQRLLPLATGDGVDDFFAPESPLRAVTENFAEVAWAALELLRRDDDGSAPMAAALARFEAHLRDVPRPATAHDDARAGALVARLRLGDRVLRTVTTVVRFNTARDLTVDGLHVELVFPADEATATHFAALAALADLAAAGAAS